jgi:predicted amidohydrolase
MDRLRIDLWTIDIGAPSSSPADFAEAVTQRVHESWQAGADLVLLPEFCWLGLERHFPGPDSLHRVADCFWNQLWPDMQRGITRQDKAAVLGSVPCVTAHGQLRNRAPIVAGEHAIYQDKIHLTPWESAFHPGDTIHLWQFCSLRLAVLICLDVEIPELSAALRGQQLDLLLVPSATETILGVERVGRCASARAVELGCHVAVSHLVGRGSSCLVDENLGRLAVYSPSQTPFQNTTRHEETFIFRDGCHCHTVEINLATLRESRAESTETNPARVEPVIPRLADSSH